MAGQPLTRRAPALVLDAAAIRLAAAGDPLVRAWLERVAALDGLVAVSAVSVVGALGDPAAEPGRVHLVLAGCVVVAADDALALHAASLCRRGHGQDGGAASAALVAATAEQLALRYERPVVLLAGDPTGLAEFTSRMPEVFLRTTG